MPRIGPWGSHILHGEVDEGTFGTHAAGGALAAYATGGADEDEMEHENASDSKLKYIWCRTLVARAECHATATSMFYTPLSSEYVNVVWSVFSIVYARFAMFWATFGRHLGPLWAVLATLTWKVLSFYALGGSGVLSPISIRFTRPFDYWTPFPFASFNQTAWRLVVNTHICARLCLWLNSTTLELHTFTPNAPFRCSGRFSLLI